MLHRLRREQTSDSGAMPAAVRPSSGAPAAPSPRQSARRLLSGDFDLSGASLAGACLDRRELAGVRFRNACLRGASFVETNLVGADFTGADLRGGIACLTEPALQSGSMRTGADPSIQVSFAGADLCGADLSRALMSGACLAGANMRGVTARETDFSGADLSGSNLTDADLTGARLCGANLGAARLTNSRLTGADLRGASLSTANVSALRFACPSKEAPQHGLRGLMDSHRLWVESHGFDGDRLVLPDLVAESFDISRQVLTLADFRFALFKGCCIRGIDLRQADLRSARFLNCDLTGASFRGANLTESQFIGCRLVSADFRQFDALSFEPTVNTVKWPTRLSSKTKFDQTNLEHARFDMA